MKLMSVVMVFSVVSCVFAADDCRSLKAALKKDINALAKYLDTSAEVRKTKASDAKSMVREFIQEPELYSFNWNVKSISGDMEAGTITRGGAYDAILNTAETYYAEDADGNNQMRAIQKATYQALSHKDVFYGYDSGAQGWGGSPATDLYFLIPDCQTTMVLFLGISHD